MFNYWYNDMKFFISEQFGFCSLWVQSIFIICFVVPKDRLLQTEVAFLYWAVHQTGSNNPLGVASNIDKVPFHPYFSFKDRFGFIITLFALSTLTLLDGISKSLVATGGGGDSVEGTRQMVRPNCLPKTFPFGDTCLNKR